MRGSEGTAVSQRQSSVHHSSGFSVYLSSSVISLAFTIFVLEKDCNYIRFPLFPSLLPAHTLIVHTFLSRFLFIAGKQKNLPQLWTPWGQGPCLFFFFFNYIHYQWLWQVIIFISIHRALHPVNCWELMLVSFTGPLLLLCLRFMVHPDLPRAPWPGQIHLLSTFHLLTQTFLWCPRS